MLYVATGCRFTVSAGVCLKISTEVSQMDKHLQNPPNNIYAQFGDKLQREIRRQAFDKCDSFLGEWILGLIQKTFLNLKAEKYQNFFTDPMQ